MTIAFMIIAAAACGGLVLFNVARRRSERAAMDALIAKRAAARKSRVPEVSNNLKGVTASQTISPLRPDQQNDRAA